MNIFQLFYLMIPAYVANMAPVLARKIPWNTPMDFGLSLGGVRIFGDHKTWKGFIIGVVIAVLVGLGLSHIYWPFEFSAITWSLAAGAGALLGDAIKSFFKRRVGIKSGQPWIPFDQLDYSVGAIALGSTVFFIGWLNSLIVIVVNVLGHIVVNHSAYYLGIRDEKW